MMQHRTSLRTPHNLTVSANFAADPDKSLSPGARRNGKASLLRDRRVWGQLAGLSKKCVYSHC